MSAFAAAKARAQQKIPEHNSAEDFTAHLSEGLPSDQRRGVDPESLSDDGVELDGQDDVNGLLSPEQFQRDKIQLSTWVPTSNSILEDSNDHLVVRLGQGQTVCCIGQYSLQVKQGVVEIAHSTLFEGQEAYTIFAPSTGFLPVVKCLSSNGATLELSSLSKRDSIAPSLSNFSPLFRRIWNAQPKPMPDSTLETHPGGRTFAIIQKASDDSLGRPLLPLATPPEWSTALSLASNIDSQRNITAVMGSAIGGTGMFCRMFVNRYVTESRTIQRRIFFIDLDSRAQELACNGQISAFLIQRPILEPSFAMAASAIAEDAYTVVRRHCVPLRYNRDHDSHLVQCALDLIRACLSLSQSLKRNDQFQGVPILIRFPTLQQGSGNMQNKALLRAIQPSASISLARGPPKMLSELAGVCPAGTFYDLNPMTPSGTTRTLDELHDMYLLALFHNSIKPGDSTDSTALPLSHQRPRAISYAEETADIAALVLLPDLPQAGKLSALINASLLSIVVLEDTTIDLDASIKRESASGLPYVDLEEDGSAGLLDPSRSHLVGIVLIRAVDTEKQILEVLTPVNGDELDTLPKSRTLLIHGCFETPQALLLEELYWRSSLVESSSGKSEKIDDSLPQTRTQVNISIPYVEVEDADHDDVRKEGEARWRSRKFNVGGAG